LSVPSNLARTYADRQECLSYMNLAGNKLSHYPMRPGFKTSFYGVMLHVPWGAGLASPILPGNLYGNTPDLCYSYLAFEGSQEPSVSFRVLVLTAATVDQPLVALSGPHLRFRAN
jgi:hypothetical protein